VSTIPSEEEFVLELDRPPPMRWPAGIPSPRRYCCGATEQSSKCLVACRYRLERVLRTIKEVAG